ncbi:12389_t:CDS:2, partial [Cetraspora pellucida]
MCNEWENPSNKQEYKIAQKSAERESYLISTVSRDPSVRLLYWHDIRPQYPCPTEGPAKFDHQALLPYRHK